MTGPLNENAIRAWQNAKGALGASATRQVKPFQYVSLHLIFAKCGSDTRFQFHIYYPQGNTNLYLTVENTHPTSRMGS
jgi:hypothetical protein